MHKTSLFAAMRHGKPLKYASMSAALPYRLTTKILRFVMQDLDLTEY